MSQIILYDLPSCPSKGRRACWSLNPWKTRLALNFKGLDYKTDWVEYPDIAPRLKPHVPQNPPGNTPYTIPTVQLPDGTYIMDSKPIAQRLERDYPSPSLNLDSPILPEVERLLQPKVMMPLRGVWMPRVPPNLLSERSSEYFERTRAERWGKPLSQIAKEIGGEEAWIEALPGIKELGEIVKAKGGPFVMGETPSYADFVIVGALHFLKVIEEDLYSRIVTIEPAFGKLYDASSQWLKRDDY